MRPWGIGSSLAAPVLLIGGWTVAARLQRDGFDPVLQTISALAAHDADARWLMTGALAAVGACHVATAAALTSARPAGRLLLAAGGVGTALVAAFPLPVGDGTSTAHTAAATLAFGALAGWPALARTPHSGKAALVLLATLAWFVVELRTDGAQVGRSERLAAATQSLWPLAAVLLARTHRSTT